ncbi:MAG: triose-phosphate isomerase [Deltaproteobacteria bacterium]|nr:triose-phosphate isomerase [Deltaproteobacteria bacterium]MBN2673732.1 triose-phosphate isomerase [Deltaproteobacteria bacterium]
MRKAYVAGNWKMNCSISEAKELAQGLVSGLAADANADVAVVPQFLAISAVKDIIAGSPIKLGAQDVYFEKNGAFTGEVSAAMLKDAGCDFALVGHSERRHVIGETDEIIRKKLDALLEEGLDVILCVGEQLEEREANETEKVLEEQTVAGIKGLTKEQLAKVTIAYEPVWAIGTGKVATTEQAQSAHKFIRDLVAKLFDQEAADAVRIQYGGSVKPDNAEDLLAQPDVDGALVGGAALKADSFLGIIAGA